MSRLFLFPKIFKAAMVWVCLAGVMGSWNHAASVRRVAVDEMVQQSQLVFEGEVLALDSAETGHRRIHTYVTFAWRTRHLFC